MGLGAKLVPLVPGKSAMQSLFDALVPPVCMACTFGFLKAIRTPPAWSLFASAWTGGSHLRSSWAIGRRKHSSKEQAHARGVPNFPGETRGKNLRGIPHAASECVDLLGPDPEKNAKSAASIVAAGNLAGRVSAPFSVVPDCFRLPASSYAYSSPFQARQTSRSGL